MLKSSGPKQTPCLFGVSCIFSFLCFLFSAYSFETSSQGCPLTNGFKIALLKCSEIDKADVGDRRRWKVSWEVLESFHLK